MFHLVVTKPGWKGEVKEEKRFSGGGGGESGPSLLGWSSVRQLRRVSLEPSQGSLTAVAVQRGNARAVLSGRMKSLRMIAWVGGRVQERNCKARTKSREFP